MFGGFALSCFVLKCLDCRLDVPAFFALVILGLGPRRTLDLLADEMSGGNEDDVGCRSRDLAGCVIMSAMQRMPLV